MPVTIEIPKEKWTGKVREITLGATAAEGGTRAKTVTVGGETTLPFLHFEGAIPQCSQARHRNQEPQAGSGRLVAAAHGNLGRGDGRSGRMGQSRGSGRR